MMLLDFYKWRKVTPRELQSLIGLLNFTCSVVLPGRAFLRRLIDLAREIQRPHFKIHLNKDAKSDLIIWLSFLEQYNGRTFFLDERMSAPRYEITSDVASSKGYGALLALVLANTEHHGIRIVSSRNYIYGGINWRINV